MRSTTPTACAGASAGARSSAAPRARYPTSYAPRITSRNYVLHLGHWYAQSHPTEDFAETFAVWLAPNSTWRTDYESWHALRKLRYVDELMEEIRGEPPPVRNRDGDRAAAREPQHAARALPAQARGLRPHRGAAATTRGCAASSGCATSIPGRFPRQRSSARCARSCIGCWCVAPSCTPTSCIM